VGVARWTCRARRPGGLGGGLMLTPFIEASIVEFPIYGVGTSLKVRLSHSCYLPVIYLAECGAPPCVLQRRHVLDSLRMNISSTP
jgi:hypothetical protein